jgi:hypothetical protein
MSRLSLLVVVLGVTASSALAQSSVSDTSAVPSSVVQRVQQAFGAADASALLTPAADRVEINLFGTRTFYSRDQAFYVLRAFFEEHAPRQFEVQDSVQTEGAYFVTGTYWHVRDDRPLRVFVRLSASEAQWRLKEVRVGTERR